MHIYTYIHTYLYLYLYPFIYTHLLLVPVSPHLSSAAHVSNDVSHSPVEQWQPQRGEGGLHADAVTIGLRVEGLRGLWLWLGLGQV